MTNNIRNSSIVVLTRIKYVPIFFIFAILCSVNFMVTDIIERDEVKQSQN